MSMNLEAHLLRHFGFSGFRPLQKEIVQEVLAGRHAVAILPTGSGKSLCYQLPALLLPGLTVVISPLISLMKDQVDSLVQRGVAAVALTSHDTLEEGRAKLTAVARGEVKLLFVAPERLQNQAFLTALRSGLAPVSLLAVDEAHCVSQWGHDFRPEYRQIPEFHQAVGQPPLLALTATARPSVQTDLQNQLGVPGAQVFKASADRPNLWFGVDHCESEAEREARLAHLVSRTDGSAILYVTSRKEAEKWAERLSEVLAEPVLCYHGGMGAEERTAVQNQFMTDQVRVVVATNAFGMGIDKPDIRLVLHAGLPDSLEAYFQEVGRAGRDGRPAECRMVLVPGRDIKLREHLLLQSEPDQPALERFRQMRIYVYLKEGCRRVFLLRYFGERTQPKADDCCSACHPRLFTVEPVVRTKARTRTRKGAATPAAPAATVAPAFVHPLHDQIFERLKAWRRVAAGDRGVPAYIIFGDRDLEAIAAAAPTTLAELSGCRGIGPTKLREHGEAVLREIGGVFESFLVWLALEPSDSWKQATRRYLTPDAYREIRAALAEQSGLAEQAHAVLGGRYSIEQVRVAEVVIQRSSVRT
ncbi:MAG TPA: ATP-dependent DNA helicase RecQ [Symbiobacteriaceae bacterium]|nr:ATP-dependent DNA helicase RecQ [Symbiobacteriaceae bacterium]